jgi:hypothetical protein
MADSTQEERHHDPYHYSDSEQGEDFSLCDRLLGRAIIPMPVAEHDFAHQPDLGAWGRVLSPVPTMTGP